MHWLFYAIIAQFLWAIVNHLDKYLVSKIFKGGVGAVMIFTAMVNIIFLPILLYFQPQILTTPIDQALIACFVGVLYVLSSLFYFYALRKDDATKISVLWQMTAPISYFLAMIFLGEFLNFKQTLGAIIVLTGGILTMIRYDNGAFRFRKRVFLFMLGAVTTFAVSSLIFKNFALNFDFWSAVFFEILGAFFAGIFLVVAIKTYRQQFIAAISRDRAKILSINLINETLQISATVSFRFATLIAPVALVQASNSLNVIFVFFIAILIAIFLPHISEEKFSKYMILQKIAGIIVVTIGLILIEL